MKKITIACLALFAQMIAAQDGVLDTAFGTNGYVLANTDDGAQFARFVQSNGKIIYIQGTSFKQLNADGTPDYTFGLNGSVAITQPVYYYEGFTVANNQITLITKGLYDVYTMGRYNFDGTVDASLGGGLGYMTISVGSDIDGHVVPARSADDKLLLGGNSDTAYGSYNNYYVRRYNADGTNDNTYNFNAYSLGINISQTSIGYYTEEFINDLNVMSDGRVLVSGTSSYYESSSSFVSYRKATAALIPNGSGAPIALQHSYTAYGSVKSAVAFDQSNNIYMLGGQGSSSTASAVNSIKKWTSAGNVANSFGTSGTLTVSLVLDANNRADFRKIMVQPDGKLLLGGVIVNNGAATLAYPNLVLARFLPDGTPDATFGTDGYVLHDIAHPNTAANKNTFQQMFAASDYSSIYITGSNLQNAVVLKYGNISMTPLTVPTFTAIAPICAGDAAGALPVTSNNGVSGSWTPPTIDNTATATYTFTPSPGEHATNATLTVTVNQPTTATVNETACESYTYNGTTYNSSGTYTQVTTNAAGCNLTTTLHLIINHDTETTLTESACESFTFNGTTYTDSGVYTQLSTNASGCVHTTTLNLTVNYPQEIMAGSTQSFEEGATLADIVTSPASVAWYASAEDAAVPQNPLAASTVLTDGATYFAVHTTAQGCESAPIAVTVSVTLGTRAFGAAQFNVHPNPTTGLLSVQAGADIDQIVVYSLLGQPVLAKSVQGKQAVVDLSALSAGTYLVKIMADQQTRTVKIIKQ